MKRQYKYIAGIFLFGMGIAGLYGSVSGQLAPMIAGLITPGDLVPMKTGSYTGGTGKHPGVTGFLHTRPGGPTTPITSTITTQLKPRLPGQGNLVFTWIKTHL